MKVGPFAEKAAEPAMLVNVPGLVTAHYTELLDASVPAHRAAFGTSGYRGSAIEKAFSEWHILAIRTLAVVVLGLCLASCANNSPPVSEAEYSTAVVGRWQGAVGDVKETMSIDGDGTFICQLHPMGFIANTLSQSVTGTIRGTWKITGTIITLRITGAESERLRNKTASSTIVTFTKDTLVLKSRRGETLPFHRVLPF